MRQAHCFVLSVVAGCMIGGCTAIALNKQVDEQQRRVQQKEQELQSAESERARLEAEKQKLLRDLDNQKMTTDELQGSESSTRNFVNIRGSWKRSAAKRQSMQKRSAST
jgi:predicted nuclease with TOPRIM domain